MKLVSLSPHDLAQLQHAGLHPYAEGFVSLCVLFAAAAVLAMLAAMAILDLHRLDHAARRFLALVGVLAGSVFFVVLDNTYQDHGVAAFIADSACTLIATLAILKVFSKPEPSISLR